MGALKSAPFFDMVRVPHVLCGTLTMINALAAFLLQEGGAREKLAKENAVRGISLSAESEEAFAASTAQAFGKACAKLFIKMTVQTPLSVYRIRYHGGSFFISHILLFALQIIHKMFMW